MQTKLLHIFDVRTYTHGKFYILLTFAYEKTDQ